MNDTIIDTIMMGIELFLLVSVMSIVLLLVRTGSDTTVVASSTSVNVSKSMLNYEISKYDNEIINGASLRELIERYKSEKDVYINSKLSTFGNRSSELFKNILNSIGTEMTEEAKSKLIMDYKDLSDLDSTDKDFYSIYYDDSNYYLGDFMLFQVRIIYNEDEEFIGIYARQLD